jgi:hypothetical protein
MISKANLPLIVSRDKLKLKGAEVGKAVFDILSNPNQSPQEVGETMEAMTPRYYQELLATVKANSNKFDSPFFIVVLRKKEPWALNVLRQWFVSRQTKPSAATLREDYPNFDHDVWQVNSRDSSINFIYTLPTAQDSATILKNKDCYDPALVDAIVKFNEGKL